jgi:hypothetical protein
MKAASVVVCPVASRQNETDRWRHLPTPSLLERSFTASQFGKPMGKVTCISAFQTVVRVSLVVREGIELLFIS